MDGCVTRRLSRFARRAARAPDTERRASDRGRCRSGADDDGISHPAWPRVNLSPAVLDAVIEGLRGPFRLRLRYGAEGAPERIIEPHGLLLGHRSYLVARQPARGDDMLNFRLDRIHSVQALDESFSFSLDAYSAQSFGVYQDPAQYGEVVWRFTPEAAARAAEFCFHPKQIVDHEEDGSLIVRFHASGWLEMAWHLHQWGDNVEVIAPEGLRIMVEHHRRSDFNALP